MPVGDSLARYNVKPKRYVFTACRFVPEKGLHDLIAAYHKIDNPDLKLVIAGDADHENGYSRNLKKSTEGNSGIVLTGFLSGKPLQEIYSNAALFVLPSYYEGLPIALLEALSYGLPVLVSDIPQNREIPLPDFRYFRVGDIDDLYRKMQELINTGITEEEEKCYRELLDKEYNWDKIAQRTLNVYKSVVADSGGLLFAEKQIDVV
jgi:glycosyltransferase involved in cell wall biosynthesis